MGGEGNESLELSEGEDMRAQKCSLDSETSLPGPAQEPVPSRPH